MWKLDTKSGGWTDITPVKPDAKNEGSVGRGLGGRPQSQGGHRQHIGRVNSAGGEDEIYRTTDGGKTWKAVFENAGAFDSPLGRSITRWRPITATTPIHWLYDIEIDPLNPKHAMFTTGYGGWETFNLTDLDAGKPTRWSIMATGIEETVPLELVSPTKGAHLLSAVGDYGGFVHWDLDKPAPEGASSPPVFNNSSGMAAGDINPDVVVRVGVCSHHHTPGSTSATRSMAARPGSRRPLNPLRRRRPGLAAAPDGGRVRGASRFLPMALPGSGLRRAAPRSTPPTKGPPGRHPRACPITRASSPIA